nr:MmcQ/YjbR family DNA-binding protein [Clostridia bacterium]
EKYNKELEFLWEDTPDCAIWRNDINDTWFGLLMVVKKSKFIDNSTGEVEVLNIRFKKGETDSIVDNIGIFKAYHMNKNSWISILLNDSVNIDKIFKLLDDSYTLSVNSKKPKKKTIGFYYDGDLDIKPQNKDFAKIKDIKNIYNILNTIWSKETCAPRLRKEWTKRNNTVGQCSITAFLVQDIFGGKVYGVKLDSGDIHCFNVFDNLVVDLTSRQLKNKQIEYKLNLPQDRITHFSKQEKFDRYNTLKNALIDYLKNH